MANKKTSQEVDGVSLKFEDQIRTARSGSNFAINGHCFLFEEISFNDLYNLYDSVTFVVNKIYRVTGFNSLFFNDDNGSWKDDTIIYVTSVTGNSLSPIAYYIDPISGSVFTLYIKWWASNPLNPSSIIPVEIHRVEDDRGNVYLDTRNIDSNMPNPIPTYAQSGKNSRFTNSEFVGTIAITDDLNKSISNSKIVQSEIYANYQIIDSVIKYCYITNWNESTYGGTFQNSIIKNSTIGSSDNAFPIIQDSEFINGDYPSLNNAQIIRLKIDGNNNSFQFDGKFNDFTSYWKGEVIASNEYGYSTITLDTPYDPAHTEGCYNSDTLWLVPDSPIGIYKLQNSGVTSTLTLTYIKNNSSDAIQYKVMNDTTDGTKVDFTKYTSRASLVAAGGPNNRILEYHGATSKIGQLYNNACYTVFRKMWYDDAKSGKCYAIIPDSPHYD